jgi:hypothetical protein
VCGGLYICWKTIPNSRDAVFFVFFFGGGGGGRKDKSLALEDLVALVGIMWFRENIFRYDNQTIYTFKEEHEIHILMPVR